MEWEVVWEKSGCVAEVDGKKKRSGNGARTETESAGIRKRERENPREEAKKTGNDSWG